MKDDIKRATDLIGNIRATEGAAEQLVTAFAQLQAANPLRVFSVGRDRMAEFTPPEGYFVVSVSNTGMPPDMVRISCLPDSCKRTDGDTRTLQEVEASWIPQPVGENK